MQRTSDAGFVRDPWHRLPPTLAGLLRPRMDEIAMDMVELIRREVPLYRRPPDSPAGRDLAGAVRRALAQFVELIEQPESPQEHHADYFRRLGRIAHENGHGTDGLQAALRIGARVATRRYLEVARAAALSPEAALALSDAVLVQIGALADASVGGFAAAGSVGADELRRARRALAGALLTPGSGPLEGLAERAEWPLPERVAVLVLRRGAGGPALPPPPAPESGTLVVRLGPEERWIVPAGGGRETEPRLPSLARGARVAVGPAVAPQDAWLSLRCARMAMRLRREGEGPVRAEDHLAELHTMAGARIGELLAAQVLRPLEGLPAAKSERLAETLAALLDSWGRGAPEIAEALHIHPQTARYRLRQLEEIYGTSLADPTFRLAATIALRTRALPSALTPSPSPSPSPPPGAP
ncbi:helix-turn-helix domain-containing protein [Streptomyces sp. DSM 44917]|uniref:Helix-turn-helix domain-containing protein n=1 Tax=Streptomyces boetiae TaxID=3075541 RepID=A0ABU2L5R3_9ACTN|nr:helix-turn-helix domain-containing protein [Streptomyces sp. DSM 44917]MDT0306902.1 helix-turn-helix domain-containing protein [Streptomyces sp. DSM 44917]